MAVTVIDSELFPLVRVGIFQCFGACFRITLINSTVFCHPSGDGGFTLAGKLTSQIRNLEKKLYVVSKICLIPRKCIKFQRKSQNHFISQGLYGSYPYL
jgi:hypothetical protein